MKIRNAEARQLALGKAVELQRLLETVVKLPGGGKGSCAADALNHVESAIEMLTPDPDLDDTDEQAVRKKPVQP